MTTRSDHSGIRVYLCECGPIIREALDMGRLQAGISEHAPDVSIGTHPTLCSTQGREWMASDLSSHPDARVVVVACSPREHEHTFRGVMRQAGLNPYLLAMANIREQCTWVTPDPARALEKSLSLVRAALSRVANQVPLDEPEIDCTTDVLVVGAGVAGLSAARLLAQADRKVILVERTPAVGGRTALLADVFPGLECASCLLEPLVDDVLHDPRIEVMTYSEVLEVLGFSGNFTARILRRTRHVDPEGCYGCATCHAACPVSVPREADQGLSTRGAIHVPYTGALPNVSVVDEDACLAFGDGSCDACVQACPFGNIDLTSTDDVVIRQVGAVIVATGAEHDPASIRVADRVITTMALERLVNASGPTSGEVALPGCPPPGSLALIQCTDGSCSAPGPSCSRICCMAFAKYVKQIHEKLPGCEIHQLIWERCTGGKGYREFASSADTTPGLHQVWLGRQDRVAAPREDGDRVLVSYTLDGSPHEIRVDLAVVAPPLGGASTARPLAGLLRLDLDAQGFFVEQDPHLGPARTFVPGVLVAGCARGPADVQESSAQGAAAAANVLATLVPGRKLRLEPAVARVDAERCGGCRTCILTCPFRAVTWDRESGTATVDEVICRGCGSCAAACPAGAIVARHFTDEQIGAEIFEIAASRRRRR